MVRILILEQRLGWSHRNGGTMMRANSRRFQADPIITTIRNGIENLQNNAFDADGNSKNAYDVQAASDVLFHQIGAQVWRGAGSDRPAWVASGGPDVCAKNYPRDLCYDNPQDREELRGLFWKLIEAKCEKHRSYLKLNWLKTRKSTNELSTQPDTESEGSDREADDQTYRPTPKSASDSGPYYLRPHARDGFSEWRTARPQRSGQSLVGGKRAFSYAEDDSTQDESPRDDSNKRARLADDVRSIDQTPASWIVRLKLTSDKLRAFNDGALNQSLAEPTRRCYTISSESDVSQQHLNQQIMKTEYDEYPSGSLAYPILEDSIGEPRSQYVYPHVPAQLPYRTNIVADVLAGRGDQEAVAWDAPLSEEDESELSSLSVQSTNSASMTERQKYLDLLRRTIISLRYGDSKRHMICLERCAKGDRVLDKAERVLRDRSLPADELVDELECDQEGSDVYKALRGISICRNPEHFGFKAFMKRLAEVDNGTEEHYIPMIVRTASRKA